MTDGNPLVPGLATEDDHLLAGELATVAGRGLVGLQDGTSTVGWRLGDAGDITANRYLLAALAAARPRDSVLSEEAFDDQTRLHADRIWILDPLDGTREYSERGRIDWAVHVALIVDGDLAAGAVALPASGITFHTGPGGLAHGMAVDAPRGDAAGRPRMVVSRSRPAPITGAIQAAIGGALIPLGSAGAKAMAVVRGDAEVYAHAGGQYEWDNAAPAAVAAAAGLWVSRLDGSPLRYNQPDPWLPDLLICLPDLAPRILEAVAAW